MQIDGRFLAQHSLNHATENDERADEVQRVFPALAARRFGGSGALGLLYAAPAAGAFVISGTSGWTRRVRRHGLGILLAASVWGAAIVGSGQTIPDSLRGRLAGIELISYSSGPALGNVEAGGVAALTSPAVSVVSGGLLCVAGTVIFAAVLPGFRKYASQE
jgi:hypothetical protein